MRAFSISIFLVLSLSSVSYACSCSSMRFQDKVDRADEIFHGRILEVKSYIVKTIDGDKYTEWYFTFDVIKKWKGNRKKRVKIYMEGTSCDFYFDIFQDEYLVYAKKGPSVLSKVLSPSDKSLDKRVDFFENKHTTSLCSGTTSQFTRSGVLTTDNFKYEFSDLNKTFPDGVFLIPYYINFTNIFFLTWVILPVGFYFRKKKNIKK